MANLNNVHRYIAAGFARLDVHRLDNKGLPAGITGTVVAGPAGAAAARISAVTTMNLNIPAAQTVPIPGDNSLQGTFQFSSEQARTFDLAFSEDDFDDRQVFQPINARDIGNHSFAGRDISPFVLNSCMLIGISNAKAQAPAVKGLGLYAGVLAARAEMTVRGRSGYVNKGAALFNGTVTLNAFSSYPWGETFQPSVEGYDSSFAEDFTLPFPVTCHRWIGGSGNTTFILGEIPASTSLDDILIYTIDSNGNFVRKTTGVTITPATRQVVFSAAPDGLDVVAWYGYVPS